MDSDRSSVTGAQAAGATPRLPDDFDPFDIPAEDAADAGTGRRDLAGLAIAAGLLVLAILIVNDATGYVVRRNAARFGPDIFPYLVGTALVGAAALTVIMALRGRFPARERLNWPGFLWVVAALAGEIVLLKVGTGFIPASAVLFGLAARGFGQKPVWRNILVGGVLSALLYILFRFGLGLSLPEGPIEQFLSALLR